jgi:hypothetical protein
VNAEAGVDEQAADDEPPFRHEQPGALEGRRIGNETIRVD